MIKTSTLIAKELSVSYGKNNILENLSLQLDSGKITVIIGPNACGKSTLLKTLARLLPPNTGQVLLDGREINALPTKQVAVRLGFLPQSPITPSGITVGDLVSRGRHPHLSWKTRWSSSDEKATANALEMTGTADLVDRPVDELSGGQRQRVWIALALAQQTEILLLDEPTTYLDLSHQIDVLDLLSELNQSSGTTICMVLHDLNLAARYAHKVVAMRDGGLIAQGTPQQVFTESTIQSIYGLKTRIIYDPVSSSPLVVPIGRCCANSL